MQGILAPHDGEDVAEHDFAVFFVHGDAQSVLSVAQVVVPGAVMENVAGTVTVLKRS